jgi:stage V sporulation protein B
VSGAIGEGKGGRALKIVRAALVYAFIFGAASSLLLYFSADIVSSSVLKSPECASALKILSFSLVPIALGTVISGYFVGIRRVGFNCTVQILSQAIRIATTVFLILRFGDGDAYRSVSLLALSSSLSELFAFLLIFGEYAFHKKLSGECERVGLSLVAREAMPIALSAYVRSLLISLEHILIPRKLRERGEDSSEAYAHYGTLHGMALPVVLYPMTPLSSFAGLLVPEFSEDLSRGNYKRMSRVASEAVNATLVYSIFFSVFTFVFSEELGFTFFSSYDAGFYISALSFVIPIMYLDHITDQILKGVGEQVYSMWVNITDSLLSLLLIILLIPRLGIAGYAVVIVVMEGYNFLLSTIRLRKRIRVEINVRDALLFPLVSSALAAYLSRSLFNFGSRESALWLILKGVFMLSVFVFVYSILRLFKSKKESERPYAS